MTTNDDLNKIQETLGGVKDALTSLGDSVKYIRQLDTAIVGLNTHFATMNKGLAGSLDNFTKFVKGTESGGKRIKVALEKTWSDILDDRILKTLERQNDLVQDAAAGTEKFNEKLMGLKRTMTGDLGILDADQLGQSLDMMDALDTKLGVLESSAMKAHKAAFELGKTGSKLNFDTASSVKGIRELQSQMDALKQSTAIAVQQVQGLDQGDVDAFAAKVGATGIKFTELMAEADAAAASVKKLWDENPDKYVKEMEEISRLAVEFKVTEEQALKINERLLKIKEESVKVSAKTGKEEQKITDTIKKQGQARLSGKPGLGGKGGALDILKSFKSGGMSGGLSAMAGAHEAARAKLINGNMSDAQKIAGFKKLGYHAEDDGTGNLRYKPSSLFAKVAGRMRGLQGAEGAEGYSGMISGAGGSAATAAKAAQSLSAAGEAASGLATAAEGTAVAAEAAAVGEASLAAGGVAAGAGLGAAAVAAGVFAVAAIVAIAAFKAYSAVVDHAAKKYREVRAFGGTSGLAQGRDLGTINFSQDASSFRKKLVTGGGIDDFYASFEKRMEMLQGAQSAGMNAGRIHADVQDSSFQDPSKYNATAQYMRAAASSAELFGKDLKEAAAEVATFHEELSMSFESIELFFANTAKAATAAGISNEKFMKMTRDSTNQQQQFGWAISQTSKFLQVLGASGSYTSETIKKAFESMLPKKQSDAQKVVSAQSALSGDKSGIVGAISSSMDSLTKHQEDLQKKIDANPDDEESKKEFQSGKLTLSRMQEAKDAANMGGSSGSFKLAGVMEDLPVAVRSMINLKGVGNQVGGDFNKKLQGGASEEELLKELRKIPAIQRQKMAEAYGVKDIDEIVTNMKPMQQGAISTITGMMFDKDGKTRKSADPLALGEIGTENRQLSKKGEEVAGILQKAGLAKDESEALVMRSANGDPTAKKELETALAAKGIGVNQLQMLSEAASSAVEAVKYSKEELEELRKIQAASAEKKTDMADKIINAFKGDLEDINSFTETAAAVLKGKWGSDATKELDAMAARRSAKASKAFDTAHEEGMKASTEGTGVGLSGVLASNSAVKKAYDAWQGALSDVEAAKEKVAKEKGHGQETVQVDVGNGQTETITRESAAGRELREAEQRQRDTYKAQRAQRDTNLNNDRASLESLNKTETKGWGKDKLQEHENKRKALSESIDKQQKGLLELDQRNVYSSAGTGGTVDQKVANMLSVERGSGNGTSMGQGLTSAGLMNFDKDTGKYSYSADFLKKGGTEQAAAFQALPDDLKAAFKAILQDTGGNLGGNQAPTKNLVNVVNNFGAPPVVAAQTPGKSTVAKTDTE